MPRPLKRGIDSFSLDTDFFQDETVKALRRKYGSVGVLVYLNLLCRIYRNGYFIEFDRLDELAVDIAEETAGTHVIEIVNYLVERGTLDEALFKRGVISGKNIRERYVLSARKIRHYTGIDVHALEYVDSGKPRVLHNVCETPPMFTEIATEFRDVYDMYMTESMSEAQRFYEFNQARGWDCLPNWRVAAARWHEQKTKKEVAEDKR